MDIKTQLTELREQQGLSKYAVAKRMGVTVSAISRIERQPDIMLSTVQQYAEAVGFRLVLEPLPQEPNQPTDGEA